MTSKLPWWLNPWAAYRREHCAYLAQCEATERSAAMNLRLTQEFTELNQQLVLGRLKAIATTGSDPFA
jgi:hypothetical protein